ncbi:MAG: pyruvate kinase [Spirochaetia bacterium]
MHTKTKIVCTLGPASSDPAVIQGMFEAGMDVARLNFSHGSYDEHRERVEILKNLGEETGRSLGILQDLSGPKIRTGELPDTGVPLATGATVILVPHGGDAAAGGNTGGAGTKPPIIPVQYSRLLTDIPEGSRILMDDGLIEAQVERRTKRGLECRVSFGGLLLSHKGVNFPDVTLGEHAPTPDDLEDLRFGIELGVDFVALSFVQTADDILALKDEIDRLLDRRKEESQAAKPGEKGSGDSPPAIIAKLERGAALDNLDGILQIADGVMVARGDLGLETELTMIPVYQKRIIREANRRGKMVITATQMLDSMIRTPSPTRAEVTDVANAIYDGSDAVMLSGETAVGRNPVSVVKTMRRIAYQVEQNLGLDLGWGLKEYEHEKYSESMVVAQSSCSSAENLGARWIVAHTMSGLTARLISQQRPPTPILAVTPYVSTHNQLSLVWGVESILLPVFQEDFLKIVENTEEHLKDIGYVEEGDTIVISAGIPMGSSGGTNVMKVHRVERD